MAYVSTQKISNAPFADRISALASGFGKRVSDYRLYRRTLFELQAMNSRELADLGLHASDLTEIAHAAVYGSAK